MFSFPEILVILIVAVIVLGPKRLPETARKLGRWIGILKQAGEEFKKQLMTMDRMVEDTLNRSVSDLENLEPEVEQVFENVEASVEDAINAATLPPMATPDDVWNQAPVPGGLASNITETVVREKMATAQTSTLNSSAQKREVESASNSTSVASTTEVKSPANSSSLAQEALKRDEVQS